jgi:hypothetical protein
MSPFAKFGKGDKVVVKKGELKGKRGVVVWGAEMPSYDGMAYAVRVDAGQGDASGQEITFGEGDLQAG